MNITLILVGAGGAAGSVLRYLMSTLPMNGALPFTTLLTNFAGALLIGILAGLSSGNPLLSPQALSLLKTGFCGGFTTFSTFSLETVTLLEENRLLAASLYAALSLFLCLLGVMLGKLLAARLRGLF